jgi:hypothetical protein
LLIRYRYHGLQSGLFCTGSLQRVPPPLRPDTYLFEGSVGYDGQFYRYVAHDPFFRRGFAADVDDARLRYERILIPFVAWAVSGGQDRFIDRVYQFTVVLLCALGIYWTCGWLRVSGCPPAWGIPVFLLLPATLTSLDRMLTDGPLCACFAGYMYYATIGRWKAVYLIAAVAPLIRETGVLILAGVLAGAFLHKRWRHIMIFATALLPTLVWFSFVADHTGVSSLNNMQKPVVGLLLRLFTIPGNYPGWSGFALAALQAVETLAIAGYIFCLGLAAIWIWQKRAEWRCPVIISIACFVVLGMLLGTPFYLLNAYGYARPLSPLFLWIALIALVSRKWAALIPLVLVSSAVAIYPAFSTWQAMGALFRL